MTMPYDAAALEREGSDFGERDTDANPDPKEQAHVGEDNVPHPGEFNEGATEN